MNKLHYSIARRPGVWVLTFDMTDYKNSVTVRNNMRTGELRGLQSAIAPGMWLRVQALERPTERTCPIPKAS